MRMKVILLTVITAVVGAGVSTASAQPTPGGQGSEFQFLNTSSVSSSHERLLWAGTQTEDPQICWLTFQYCQYLCGHQYVIIPDPSDTCAYACWEQYLTCMGFN